MINRMVQGTPVGCCGAGGELVSGGQSDPSSNIFQAWRIFFRHQRSEAWGWRKHLARAGAAGRRALNSTPHVPLSLCGQLFYGRRGWGTILAWIHAETARGVPC